jgi:hypothetical protein
MRWRPLIYLALSLAAVAGVFAAAPAPPANPNEPIATRQDVFSIPFDRPKAAAEVELRVSADQGSTWQSYTKVKPEQGSFVFRPPRDGEYWFALRTLDKQGQARPDGPPLPELKVLVDRVPPRLDLTAMRGAAGEVVIGWQAVDPNLKPETLRIEVQAGPDGAWEAVPVDTTAAVNRVRHTLVGQTTYWPKPNQGPITVRAQVSDRSGNLASKQTQPTLENSPSGGQAATRAGQTGDPKLIDPRAGAAGGAGTGAAGVGIGAATQPVSRNPFDRAAVNRGWPADAATNEPLAHAERQPVTSDAGGRGTGDGDWRASPAADSSSAQSTSQSTPVRNASTSALVGAATESRGQGGGRTLDLNLLPPGERPRMVNARSFDLEYEVDSVGTSGIAKVELWGTRDGGRTWSSFGVDSDNRSPVRVNVGGEGIYGFRIVVQSGSGLGGLPPRNGDLPEIWVGVDLTRPVAKITSAAIQPDTGELRVRWEASDELPDQRPISLSFSDHPNGPWTPIASGLENTGSYAWRLDNRAPDKIYLRLEARDEAGNVGVFVTTEPVLLDRQRPQGRIRGIRPVGDAARPAP